MAPPLDDMDDAARNSAANDIVDVSAPWRDDVDDPLLFPLVLLPLTIMYIYIYIMSALEGERCALCWQ